MRCVTIVLVERGCTGCINKWSSLLEDNVYLQRLNGITLCITFVLVQNCVRVKCSSTNCNCERVFVSSAKLQVRTCFCFECKTVTASARARTLATNAYTKHGIENSFPRAQMFVQLRNQKCLQQIYLMLNYFCALTIRKPYQTKYVETLHDRNWTQHNCNKLYYFQLKYLNVVVHIYNWEVHKCQQI